MILVQGKYYKAENGLNVGPMVPDGILFKAWVKGRFHWWRADGTPLGGHQGLRIVEKAVIEARKNKTQLEIYELMLQRLYEEICELKAVVAWLVQNSDKLP